MAHETRRIVAILFSDIAGREAAGAEDTGERRGAEVDDAAAVTEPAPDPPVSDPMGETRALPVTEPPTEPTDPITESTGPAPPGRAAQREIVERYQGDWMEEIAGGALCTFGSPWRAVACAVEMQRTFRDRGLRIGVHVGDLVFRTTDVGTTVFGDAVNVAARIQGVAEPGAICISERVREDLRRQTRGLSFRSLGEQHLKNVNRPVQVYQVIDRDAEIVPPEESETSGGGAGWRLPLLGVAIAAGLAALAAFLVSRPDPSSEAPDAVAEEPGATGGEDGDAVAGEETETVAEAGEPATGAGDAGSVGLESAAAGRFAEVRRALLGLEGTGAFAARVWTIPDPVKDDSLYHVAFEASCDCTALVFAVDGSGPEIALLYPNQYEPEVRTVAGESVKIPSSEAWRLRAVGGEGIDVLKLVVSTADIGLPGAGDGTWRVTPDQPERLAELEALLEDLSDAEWDAATAPLQIIP